MKRLSTYPNLIKVKDRQSEELNLLARGITNQKEIALILHISPATVNRDLKFIARRTSANLHNWIDEMLPLGLKSLVASNDLITKEVWELLDKNKDKDSLEERKERRELLQFLAALNWQKRNYMVDYDNVVLQVITAPRAGIPED